MSDEKLSDRDAFNIFVRAGQRRNKVNWTPAPGQDDRDALNRALRRAGGKDAPEPVDEPQSHPWKSINSLEDES